MSMWPAYKSLACVLSQESSQEREESRTQTIMGSESTCFTVEAMVRGYHVYKNVWEAQLTEELPCQRESGNPHDPFAVAVKKGTETVGHVPRKISSVCALFLRRGGSIRCRVTGRRRFSEDLPQGGLEVPCILSFEGAVKEAHKAEKLVRAALDLPKAEDGSPSKKKRKLSDENDPPQTETSTILRGDKLNDEHINRAQRLIKQQFPQFKGLQLTLLQEKKCTQHNIAKNIDEGGQIQVIHTRGDHWIVASSVGCLDHEVVVYDSLFSTLDEHTQEVILRLFHPRTLIRVITAQKQEGGKDCGLFALANATAIAHGVDPLRVRFRQAAMRPHLAKCLQESKILPFPSV